jgi:hypothetical protein
MTKQAKFEVGKSYPIDTLPDDLYDDEVPTKEKWSLRTVLFWNDCQGWWTDPASEFMRCKYQENPVARFWAPCPEDPMTREAILAERGLVICPKCDVAREPASQCCGSRTPELIYVDC